MAGRNRDLAVLWGGVRGSWFPTLDFVKDGTRPVLEELAGGQIANKPSISSEEVVRRQIFQFHPLHLVEDPVFQLAIEGVHRVKLQVDRASMTVVVPDAGDACPDDRSDTQLFVELAA
jgi:hypothetical protein